MEKERIKALGSSNLLKSMAKQRETQRKQYKVKKKKYFPYKGFKEKQTCLHVKNI